jgi:hypothetical protein
MKTGDIIDFLEKEKELGVLRIKVKHTHYQGKNRCMYAAVIVLENNQDVIGKHVEMIPVKDLSNDLFYVGGKGEIKSIHLGEIKEQWIQRVTKREQKGENIKIAHA